MNPVRLVVVVMNIAMLFLWVWRNPFMARTRTTAAMWERAVRAERAGDWAHAVPLFGEVARREPESSRSLQALWHKANIEMDETGDFAAAREDFSAYLARGAQGSRADRARERLEFLEAIATLPPDRQVRLVAARILVRNGRAVDAQPLLAEGFAGASAETVRAIERAMRGASS